MKANNPEILNLLTAYKSRIAESHLKDEVYKWELLANFKGRPNTNAPDFAAEYKEVKFSNLIYALSVAVGNGILKKEPEAFRALFVYLFDESKPLDDRVHFFNEESLKLYKSIDGQHSHHQDERAISTYLTFHNPEKYTFYKSSFYKPLCELMNVQPAGKNRKYGHYLELVNQFIQEYIVTDQALIEQVKAYIPEYYDGTNHLLLAQDILYQMLDKNTSSTNYWVFQGNPKIYDIQSALNADAIKSWSVNAHKDAIKPGDKVILWATGEQAGVYALGEVTSEPIERKEEPEELAFYKTPSENNEGTRVSLEITNNLANSPITKEEIATIKALEKLKVGSQGTNFSATKEQYTQLLEMITGTKKNTKLDASDFTTFIKQFNPNDFAQFIDFAREIINEHHLNYGDKRLTFNYYDNRIVISVGQRYCLGLYNKDPKRKFSVLSKEPLTPNGEVFEGENNKAFLNYLSDLALSDAFKENIHEGISNELRRTVQSGYRKHNKEVFEKYVYQLKDMNSPINQILFGPPGTGKTFTLKTEYFPQYTTKEINLTKEQHVENVIRDLTWWQVIAIVVLKQGKTKVGSVLNHPWIIQKAKLSNSNTVRPTLWGQLQSHTVPTCDFVNVKAKQQPFIFNKTEDSYWEIVEEELKEHYPEIYDLVDSLENFKPDSSKEIKRYVFTTFHQSFNYEDFIEGIKPVLSENQENSDVSYQIEDGIFKALCLRAESDPENRYAIFIDEINRGNVSNIFGELITLIEHDKRQGAEHAMSATLPYSKKAFSVPSNVDIYGTMNTADRSVEALDSALRRRFSFVEMLPKPELIKTKGPLKSSQGKLNGIDLSVVLTTINKRIEKLLDKDHQIGHSYFLQVSNLDQLKQAFQSSIIPLLQEYFFGDYGKIGLVLGQGFFAVQESSDDENFFAEFNDYELDGILDKKVYHLIDVTLLDDASFTELVLAILPRS
jgi:hypothetical protein